MNKPAYAFLFLLTIMPFSGVFAQGRDMKKEHVLEQQLEKIAPAYVDEFKKGTIAMDKQSYVETDSLYSIVYAHAPTFDPVIRRLGTTRVSLGKRDEGIALCEKALELNRSSANIIMLVSCLITPADTTGPAPAADMIRSISLLNEGKYLPDSDEWEYNSLLAQLALETNDVNNFREATMVLIRNHSDQMSTHYFMAILAANDADWVTADHEIRVAHKMGLPTEDMNAILNSSITEGLSEVKTAKSRWAAVQTLLWVVLAWAIGFVLLFILGFFLSRYTLRSIEKQVITNDLQSGSRLRQVYKILINSAGFYYYISLPVVLILVIAVGGTIVYTFYSIGILPIKLLALVIIGVAITVFGMLRSLFLKSDPTDPGRELKQEEAPELFALTKEVAATLGTRPIDEIRITPNTDLAVYETGSWREKMSDSGKRILILGTAVLKDFKKNDFRAVLAHEYGHFSNRDTAGGGVALRVRNDMNNYYVSLYNAGQAAWWNVAFLFLRFYNILFRRISAGATRLQEVLADRVAAQTYGAKAFEGGLTFVIRRDIEFTTFANAEIKSAEEAERPYSNLYELSGEQTEDVEKEFEKSLNRKTSEDDTHPSPADRFRYIQGITEQHPTNDSGYVNDLFTNWNELTQEMTALIQYRIKTR